MSEKFTYFWGITVFRGGSRINFRVLQNFTKKIEHRNDIICRKIIDSARSKKVQFAYSRGANLKIKFDPS